MINDIQTVFHGNMTEMNGRSVIEVPESEAKHLNGDEFKVALVKSETDGNTAAESKNQRPPVEEGETYRVEIVSEGDQGDGIAKVDRGYVLIVEDADVGEVLNVVVTTVRNNYAYAVPEGETY